MKSFVQSKSPVLTVMLKRTTKEELFKEVTAAKEQGAEAFGISVGGLSHEFRTYEFYKSLFSHIGDYPIYFTNYRRDNRYPELSDDELADNMLLALDAGASLLDLPGDFFSPSDGEIATNREAIKKQMEYIEKVHAKGGEVLMSSHVLRYIPKETVYSIALMHKSRGADISKIVTNADTEEELTENLEASLLLKRKLGLPYLFLCNGEKCFKHRRLGTSLGSSIFLVTEDSAPLQNQPRISVAKEILSLVEQL